MVSTLKSSGETELQASDSTDLWTLWWRVYKELWGVGGGLKSTMGAREGTQEDWACVQTVKNEQELWSAKAQRWGHPVVQVA
jgi:hypothetical protein